MSDNAFAGLASAEETRRFFISSDAGRTLLVIIQNSDTYSYSIRADITTVRPARWCRCYSCPGPAAAINWRKAPASGTALWLRSSAYVAGWDRPADAPPREVLRATRVALRDRDYHRLAKRVYPCERRAAHTYAGLGNHRRQCVRRDHWQVALQLRDRDLYLPKGV